MNNILNINIKHNILKITNFNNYTIYLFKCFLDVIEFCLSEIFLFFYFVLNIFSIVSIV